jgi:hypothetical protein
MFYSYQRDGWDKQVSCGNISNIWTLNKIRQKIFSVKGDQDFNETALEIFYFQYTNNPVYRSFVDKMRLSPHKIQRVEDVPFLPVEFFKTSRVVSFSGEPEKIFRSSGTTGMTRSSHEVMDLALYRESLLNTFRLFYGEISDYCVVALIPSFTKKPDSSLAFMVNELILASGSPESGFYPGETDRLGLVLKRARDSGRKPLLFGLSHALLDLAEEHRLSLDGTIVMETGGMKGRKIEITRQELHRILCTSFRVGHIHSEYGMTELLSQSYSSGGGRFLCPPWLEVFIRQLNDPLSGAAEGETGGINFIDLANLYSCSFLATGDLGRKYKDGSFEVLGRFDASDLRGCNLML